MNRKMTPSLSALIMILALVTKPASADSIVIYGATGNIGSKIVAEALDRDHKVIGVSRNPESLDVEHPNFSAIKGDVSDFESMLKIIDGVDTVVLSVRGYGPNNFPEETINYRSSKMFITISRAIGKDAPRVIHLGGSSTLLTDGILGLDTQLLDEGTTLHGLLWGHWLTLQNYRATTSVKWTVISPSGPYNPDGPRTGTYRTGSDEVLVNENGQADGISHRDMAAAIIDEIEAPQSIGKRMTVGY